MYNLFWPIYIKLERSFDDLTRAIHMGDDQLKVYSTNIADLILRAGSEIESIAKALYKLHVDAEAENIKFDEMAIKDLSRLWKLDKKVVLLSHPNCFITENVLCPFVKNENRTGKPRKTFGWNNAYQNLKHDRLNGFEFANIRYLIDIMAALFVLNLYYLDKTFDLAENSPSLDIPNRIGSQVFSFKVLPGKQWTQDGNPVVRDDFDECLYFVSLTAETRAKFVAITRYHHEILHDEYMKLPQVQQRLKNATPEQWKTPGWLFSDLDVVDECAAMAAANTRAPNYPMRDRHQAVPNRHQF